MSLSQVIRVGLGQIRVDGGDPSSNLARAGQAIGELATAGCKLIVLPECLDLGWTHPSARILAQPIPGSHFERLSKAAAKGQAFVAAGLVERAGDKLFNAAVLLNPQGELILHHRKVNELDIGLDLYSVGDRLGVVETPLGKIGLNICADNFSDSLAMGHVMARMGAQLIVSPSAWAVPADHNNQGEVYGQLWRDAYGKLASLYDLTVIGVSNVGWINDGPWRGRKCIGCSLVMGPGGEILAQGPYGVDAETKIVVEVCPRPAIGRGTEISGLLRQRGYDGP
jgi:predicted amidohydrolase